MEQLYTLTEIAPSLGVSRQAIDQALAKAREDDRPVPVVTIAGNHGYRRNEVEAWWKTRAEKMWKERRRVGNSKSIQVNIRIGPDDLAILDALRQEQETRSAAGHRILTAALADLARGA